MATAAATTVNTLFICLVVFIVAVVFIGIYLLLYDYKSS